MPITAASLKLRRFRNRFGIRATRLEVRPRFAWYAYALGGALVSLLLVVLVLNILQLLRPPEVRDMETLQERLSYLEGQLLQGGGALSSLEAAQSTNESLVDELRASVDEQAVLKDDLAYFLRLVPGGVKEGDARLDRLVLRPDPQHSGHYRFSVLVGYHSGRQPQEFSGRLEFTLTLVRGGKELQVVWPGKEGNGSDFAVTTRHWLRKEGVIPVLPGDVLKRADLRLLQGKTVRASTTVTF